MGVFCEECPIAAQGGACDPACQDNAARHLEAAANVALVDLFHKVMPCVMPCPAIDAPEDVEVMLAAQDALIELFQRGRRAEETLATIGQQVALGSDYEHPAGQMNPAMSSALDAFEWVASTLREDGYEIPVHVDDPESDDYHYLYSDGTTTGPDRVPVTVPAE